MIGTEFLEDAGGEIPRAEKKNPYNYDELQLATKNKALKDAAKDFPNIPEKWIEWMYDSIENKPQEEVEEIIKTGAWLKPVKTDRQIGGVIKGACEVFEDEHQEKLSLGIVNDGSGTIL